MNLLIKKIFKLKIKNQIKYFSTINKQSLSFNDKFFFPLEDEGGDNDNYLFDTHRNEDIKNSEIV